MGSRRGESLRGRFLVQPRPLAIERHAHGHARPFAEPAADRHLAAVEPEQPLDDGEAEAGAAVAAVVSCARLKIGLTDPDEIFAADADAVVLDDKDDARRLGTGTDRHLAAAIREPDRI